MDNIMLRKSVRIVLATLSTIFMIIMVWVILDCFPRNVVVEDRLINYESESNMSYFVESDDLGLIKGEVTQEDNLYIGSIINSITLKFDYFFRADHYVDSKYNYHVIAVLRSMEDDEIVWRKKIDITRPVEGEIDNTKIVLIEDEIKVPFTDLYSEAMNYYYLTDKDVILDLEVVLENNFKINGIEDDYISASSDYNVSMPITDKTFKISNISKVVQKKSVGTTHEEKSSFNSYLFSLSMICFVSLIPVAIMSYASLFNLTNYDEYKRKLKSIRKKYYSYIVPRASIPSFKKKEIIEVKEFTDLLDHIEDEDIMFFEKEKGMEAWFYLEKKKEVYLYILKLEHTLIDMSDNTKIKPLKTRKK